MADAQSSNNSRARYVRIAGVYGLPIIWGGTLLVTMHATNPLEAGPLSVLIVFILIYLMIASALFAAVYTVLGIGRLIGLSKVVGLRTLYYLTSVVALGPVFFVALNTLGYIEIKDFILVILVIALGCFYVLRRR